MLTNRLYKLFSFYVNEPLLISHPSAMDKKIVLRRFDLFNSQYDHYNAWSIKIQQFLYYAESRFWSILNNLALASDARQIWGQILLHREVVSYVV
jgi:hypothetical protein